MKRIVKLTLTIMLASITALSLAKEIQIGSPNGQIKMSFVDNGDIAQYKVYYKKKLLIQPSKLGFTFKDAKPLYRDFTVSEVNRTTHQSSWEQPWGEQRVIENHYNELRVKFSHKTDASREFDLVARVFNDGIGFKYIVPAQSSRKITRELTEFFFTDSHKATAHWIPGQSRERYEYLYRETPLQEVYTAHTPFTVVYDDNTHVAIHEAALVDYAGMSISRQQLGRFTADLAPRSDGILVEKAGEFSTPWRTITIGDKAVDLVNSYLTLNLNEANKLGDVSWVTPGKYIGIWWGMHIAKYTWGSGEKHGATTERAIEYMNFAAEHGFDGVLVEGWNIGWDGDWIANSELFSFTEAYPDFDIEKVAAHANQVGVKLVGHHETSGGITNYEKQMEDGFALYEKLGVSQIKTGYVAHGQNLKRRDENGVMRYEFTDSQPLVNHFIHNVSTAAKYKLSINTHESVKDTGLRRTYPNWISRESARGQEYNSGWAAPNPPNHIPQLVFTRMLSGPMDFTPGIFDFAYPQQFPQGHGGGDEWGLQEHMRPHSTLARQLAQYVVIYSPIQMAADLPENYLAKPNAFQFIKDIPTDWEQTIALDGAVGDFIVIARKEKTHRHYSGNDWYIGGITNEDARDVSIALDFLQAGKAYEAQVYQDGKDVDWQTNPYAISINKKAVTKGDHIKVKMASAGGFAIRLKMLE